MVHAKIQPRRIVSRVADADGHAGAVAVSPAGREVAYLLVFETGQPPGEGLKKILLDLLQ